METIDGEFIQRLDPDLQRTLFEAAPILLGKMIAPEDQQELINTAQAVGVFGRPAARGIYIREGWFDILLEALKEMEQVLPAFLEDSDDFDFFEGIRIVSICRINGLDISFTGFKQGHLNEEGLDAAGRILEIRGNVKFKSRGLCEFCSHEIFASPRHADTANRQLVISCDRCFNILHKHHYNDNPLPPGLPRVSAHEHFRRLQEGKISYL